MRASPLHSHAYRELCALLRRWREEAGMTQRALAERLRKPHSYVHKCEVGERRIDPLEFIRWCVGCGRKPSECLNDVQQEVQGLTVTPTRRTTRGTGRKGST